MKAVLQRVRQGAVEIDGKCVGRIGAGLVVLLGIAPEDTQAQCEILLDKLIHLRIFEDEMGKMNLSVQDTGGELLIVSQFTLYADCRKGRRPSFTNAARPETAVPLDERFVAMAREQGIRTETGVFGADMLVSIENDGPVTIVLDTDELPAK